MSTSCVEHARRFKKQPLAVGAVVLWLSWLALPALGQMPASEAALPDAPSVSSSSVGPTVAYPIAADHSLTFGKRARVYAGSIFSWQAIVAPAFGASIGQADNEPPTWGGGAEAYGKRFGSAAARYTISETVRFGIAAADGEDPRYFLSEDRSVWGRTRHAVLSTFVSPTSHGVTIPAFSRFVGVYGAAFIANTWYPDNRATAGDAAVRGTTALVGSLGFHLVREFVPFLNRTSQ